MRCAFLLPHCFPHSHASTSGLGMGTEGQLPQSKQAFVEALSWTTLRASLARNSASHLWWPTLSIGVEGGEKEGSLGLRWEPVLA